MILYVSDGVAHRAPTFDECGKVARAVDVADDPLAKTVYRVVMRDGDDFFTLSLALACNALNPIAGAIAVHVMEIV